MKKIIIIELCILITMNLYSRGNTLDSLSVFDKIEKDIIGKIELKKSFNKDSIILFPSESKIIFDGISVSGAGEIYSDTSLIRIIAVDSENNEYLIYESTILSDEMGKTQFYNRSDETFWIESCVLQKVIIQLSNAEVEINDLTYYSCVEKDNKKKELLKDNLKREIADKKFKTVQAYIKRNKMIWTAYNNSNANRAYSSKKKEYGEKYNTYGLEYYQDGFFKLPPSFSLDQVKLKSATTTSFVSEFDWRNRHGQNWLTPNKCQSGCWLNNSINCNYSDPIACANAGGEYRETGACWAFGPIAAMEALTNLYFNQHIDYDLSEQQLVSCCFTYPDLKGYESNAMNNIRYNGAIPESCNPYIAQKGSCGSACTNPQDRVSYLNSSYIWTEDDLKSNLIAHGPMPCDMGAGWSHTILYVGFGTIKAGDYIDFLGNQTIQPGDDNIGKTYWILKQSNTHTGWPYHAGFIYMLDKPDDADVIYTPISSLVYGSEDIVCCDNDHDGYFWWGIGLPKPETCIYCSSNEEDGDDSNPNLGPMDEYGNCRQISSPYTFPEYQITGTVTWQNTRPQCGNVIVKNGGNLTLNGSTINLEGNGEFSVELGGTFTFISGTIQ